jgi:TRAP-type C4-dicarboxylate transport system permease small subunit
MLLSVLVLLASSQIVLRNVFSSGLAWGDELVRLLVLWLALIGAIAASRDGRQIRVDLLSRLVPQRLTWIPDSIAMAFTAVICGLLSWQSARFVADSRAFGDLLLGNTPAWLLQLILPVGFAIMAYRYAVRTLIVIIGGRQ